MLVGMDVSHAEIGGDSDSVAAIVGSLDGKASQYAAHISLQSARVEMISAIERGMDALLKSFKAKNQGKMPETIVIFRDGVADGQFEQVLQKELPMVKQAILGLGYTEDKVKIAVVICQKGHHTRLVFEETGGEGFVNPCPGLVIDASAGDTGITSAAYNEFYLNSHTAIQGTAKPCKYALIYDEIGFKMAELELLTYWSTYMYSRCNKSVSYATPAYYAHWASKRGHYLINAGATAEDLEHISATWTNPSCPNTMFFI
jgi:eukaryotic translation initiation factor 2C